MALALILYALWVVTTYLLEGLPKTLLRPEAQALRAAYTITANLIVGTVGSMLVLRRLIASGSITARSAGFSSPKRSVIGIALGLLLGGAVFAAQGPPSPGAIVVLNLFAQVFPVSVAEVLICWSLVGVVSGSSIASRAGRATQMLIVAVVGSVAFGGYHVAHSPPFNELDMIGLLSLVGLATSTFFIVVRDVYGTIVFHNFLALFGLLRALGESGKVTEYETANLPRLMTALSSVGLLVISHIAFLGSASKDGSSGNSGSRAAVSGTPHHRS